MLLKIICVGLLLACPRVSGYGGSGDGAQQEYSDEADSFGSYQQDDDEDNNPVRVKRFESALTVKTLSPQEIQEVRGAIKQILSGHNQENPFTPLPAIQTSNEKRSLPDNHVIHKPRSAQTSHVNYFYDARTFQQDSDGTDDTKSETQAFTMNEPLVTDDSVFKTATIRADENYDTEFSNQLTDDTIVLSSSLPVIPGTDDVVEPDVKGVTIMDEIVTDNNFITETNNYETETNMGLTASTLNVLPLATLPHIGRTADDIKSEINSILGRSNENANLITLNKRAKYDKHNTELAKKGPSLKRPRPSGETTHEMHDTTEYVVTAAAETEDSNEEVDSKELSNSKEKADEMEKYETDEEQKPEDEVEETTTTQEEVITLQTLTPSNEITGTTPEVAQTETVSEIFQNGPVSEIFQNGTVSGISQNETFSGVSQIGVLPGGSHSVIPSGGYGNRTTNKIRSTRPSRKTTTRRTKRKTTSKFKLDVPALLAIISNLTYDYEMNLTDNLNATLLKYSIPTCETPTTTIKKGLFIDYDSNATGTIIAKCFVCGLEVEQIPRDAHCADAFAGDFLPLVPVDMTARGKISKYRKYCRYADVPHYMKNETQPRSVFGRWTGGCSVRWIDLSGVYTQRSCRNIERAVMGRHFASKRMAKLEMALRRVDNGCITSPMASLVPLSRGISLYARFHACVCTGSWCNAADVRIPWTTAGLVPFLVVYSRPHLLL